MSEPADAPVSATRTVRIPELTRVEGEAALHLRIHDGTVTEARLKIYEPPRFFEAFLRGRAHTEPVDLTSRICGICPVAYQLSACRAVEDACHVVVDGRLDALRRLLYCGEWIESQTLHIYLLHAPDFLGCTDLLAMADSHRAHVERGLRLKQAGNAVVELLGGRAIHPVSVRVGGFHRTPTRAELRPLAERLRRALDDAWDTVRWVAGFDFPDAVCEADLLALAEPGTYAIQSGIPTVLPADPAQPPYSFPVQDFCAHVTEEQVPHSTALHSHLDGRLHLTGSLARYAVSGHLLSPLARQAAREAGLGDPRSPRAGRAARCAATPTGASSCAPWRSSTRWRRPCGSSTPTSRRRARTWTSPPGPVWATAPPRRRADCCTTGTPSTPTAGSPTPASSRPRPRTRPRSRRTCTPRCVPPWRAAPSPTPTSPTCANGPCATTTRASRARPTS